MAPGGGRLHHRRCGKRSGVVTLGSHMENTPVDAGASISGPLHTENLGIEKVIANVVSNPNIRFLVVCGAEVQGHITGQSIKHSMKMVPTRKRKE